MRRTLFKATAIRCPCQSAQEWTPRRFPRSLALRLRPIRITSRGVRECLGRRDRLNGHTLAEGVYALINGLGDLTAGHGPPYGNPPALWRAAQQPNFMFIFSSCAGRYIRSGKAGAARSVNAPTPSYGIGSSENLECAITIRDGEGHNSRLLRGRRSGGIAPGGEFGAFRGV